MPFLYRRRLQQLTFWVDVLVRGDERDEQLVGLLLSWLGIHIDKEGWISHIICHVIRYFNFWLTPNETGETIRIWRPRGGWILLLLVWGCTMARLNEQQQNSFVCNWNRTRNERGPNERVLRRPCISLGLMPLLLPLSSRRWFTLGRDQFVAGIYPINFCPLNWQSAPSPASLPRQRR